MHVKDRRTTPDEPYDFRLPWLDVTEASHASEIHVDRHGTACIRVTDLTLVTELDTHVIREVQCR